jgi:hypothetical protein
MTTLLDQNVESGMSTPEEVQHRLEAFRARRGYLLPHQGAMAAALPGLQDAYGPFYQALTLDPRHLDAFEREFVWLVLLITSQEHVGTHHVELFYRTGGTQRQAEAAFRLAAWSTSTATFKFLGDHWQAHFPRIDAAQAYLDGAAALVASFPEVAPALVRLGLLAAHTARGDHWGLEREIEACYAQGVDEGKMVESASLALWPCGVNRFIEACGIWLDLMRAGKVQPSPAFQAWADMPGQEGKPLAPRDPALP